MHYNLLTGGVFGAGRQRPSNLHLIAVELVDRSTNATTHLTRAGTGQTLRKDRQVVWNDDVPFALIRPTVIDTGLVRQSNERAGGNFNLVVLIQPRDNIMRLVGVEPGLHEQTLAVNPRVEHSADSSLQNFRTVA